MKRDQPPIWTWPASLALAGVVLALLVVWKDHALAGFIRRDLGLQRFATAPELGREVIVIGSSKVVCGVLFDEQMSARVKAAGADARVIRVGEAGTSAAAMAYLFTALQGRRAPNLVLIEDDLLAFEPAVHRRVEEPARRDWRNHVRSSLKSLVKGDEAFGGVRTVGAEPCTHGARYTLDEYAAQLAGRRASTPAERDGYLVPLRRLKAAGSVVGIIETPRSPAAAAKFPSKLLADGREVLDQVTKQEGFVRIGPAPPLPQDVFLDTAHLDAQGRALYSGWLADRIGSLLTARP